MKITTSEIQKNDFAAMSFYAAMNYSVKQIRENIDFYKKSRKINTSLFGHIHALRLLCVHSNSLDIPINLKEANEWKDILIKYVERIQKKIPEEIREKFKIELQNDLDIIVSKGKDYPEWQWKDQYLKREITIDVKNKELKEKYLELAENNEKYRNQLGNALHNYIKDCLDDLEKNEENKENEITSQKNHTEELNIFKPTFLKLDSSKYSYLLDNFDFFIDNEQLENNCEITAYKIEEAIKLYLTDTNPELLNDLNFDCESSLFSVQSDNLSSLIELNKHLLSIATNNKIKDKYLKLTN